MTRFTKLICAVIVSLGMLVPVYAAAEVSAPMHLALSSNVSLADPSPEELEAIFLGSKRHWNDGTRVKIAILDTADSQREFLSVVAHRSPGQFWAHWRNIVFSGRGIMPKIFRSEEELVTYLMTEKGAIGQVIDTDLASRKGAATLTLEGVPLP